MRMTGGIFRRSAEEPSISWHFCNHYLRLQLTSKVKGFSVKHGLFSRIRWSAWVEWHLRGQGFDPPHLHSTKPSRLQYLGKSDGRPSNPVGREPGGKLKFAAVAATTGATLVGEPFSSPRASPLSRSVPETLTTVIRENIRPAEYPSMGEPITAQATTARSRIPRVYWVQSSHHSYLSDEPSSGAACVPRP